MNDPALSDLAGRLARGELSLADFLRQVGQPATDDLDEAQIDLDRARRCGYPEVIFGQGKTVDTLKKIFRAQLAAGIEVLATRVSPEQAEALIEAFSMARYNPIGRTLRVAPERAVNIQPPSGRVVVVTAGTSDLPVAEEASETAQWMGADVSLICDVGVAGPQRLLEHLSEIRAADAVVVVAGMEGALPSVVGGHVACPVIAVPTSVGYGANFGGLAALLGMLNSCAANVTVVNIDAGFKGGYIAGLIAQRMRAVAHHADPVDSDPVGSNVNVASGVAPAKVSDPKVSDPKVSDPKVSDPKVSDPKVSDHRPAGRG